MIDLSPYMQVDAEEVMGCISKLTTQASDYGDLLWEVSV